MRRLYRGFRQNGHQRLVAGTVAFAEVVQSGFDDVRAEVRWVWYGIQLSVGHKTNLLQMPLQCITE